MRIAIINTHSDTFTNPTLVLLIEKLQLLGISITLFTNGQLPVSDVLEAIKAPNPFVRIPRHPKHIVSTYRGYAKALKHIRKEKIMHLFAVDQGGLIVAGRLKKLAPALQVHYLSFEILFSAELNDRLSKLLKEKEIFYSRNVASILVQDEVRKSNLAVENKIPGTFTNWFYIPVAPKPFSPTAIKKNIRQSLNVDPTDKVLIHTGSVALWSGMRILIDALKIGIPAGYKIMIHNRFAFNAGIPLHKELLELSKNCGQLILNEGNISDYDELCNFISAFDYGLALYQQEPNPYTGRNISEIGLASGKFSTYMMLGKPTITTKMQSFEALNEKYNSSRAISNEHELISLLHSGAMETIPMGNCRKLYDEVLNPGKNMDAYINLLLNITDNSKPGVYRIN